MDTKLNSDMPCNETCPVSKTADILEHKWVTLIIRDLLGGKKRYSELSRSLQGISAKVLSDRLHLLEDNHLILRTVYPTVPPSTEYELTELGKKLEVVIRAMQEFGTQLPATETNS